MITQVVQINVISFVCVIFVPESIASIGKLHNIYIYIYLHLPGLHQCIRKRQITMQAKDYLFQ